MEDQHFIFSSLPVNNCSSMNTFKTALVICTILGVCASCSSSYQPSGNQGSQMAEVVSDVHGGMIGDQSTSYANQHAAPNSPASEHQKPVESGPAFDSEKARPVVTAPTTTQYICSCITINPVAVSPHHQIPTSDSFAQAATQQQTSAAHQIQEESHVGPASSQLVSVPQQSVGDKNRGY